MTDTESGIFWAEFIFLIIVTVILFFNTYTYSKLMDNINSPITQDQASAGYWFNLIFAILGLVGIFGLLARRMSGSELKKGIEPIGGSSSAPPIVVFPPPYGQAKFDPASGQYITVSPPIHSCTPAGVCYPYIAPLKQ